MSHFGSGERASNSAPPIEKRWADVNFCSALMLGGGVMPHHCAADEDVAARANPAPRNIHEYSSIYSTIRAFFKEGR
jgi:hypothetical protein